MATVAHLDFERAIAEVEEQIERLQDQARERGLDLSDELRSLERKLYSLKREVYRNLTPIERVQVHGPAIHIHGCKALGKSHLRRSGDRKCQNHY